MNIPGNPGEHESAKKPASHWINFQYVPPLFISLILLTGHFTFGILEDYSAILLAIGCSILT
jgi:hypothetical protein